MTQAVVIIPHYNDVVRLLRCLEALRPQLAAVNANEMRADVVVVDNCSTDPLEDIHTFWPDLRILREPQKGAAAARNCGVHATQAEALFFLDADCVPRADWLATALELHAKADVTGGEVTVFDETSAPRNGAQAFETVFAFDNRAYVEKKSFSVTANLLTQRRIFQDVGDFRPGLSEDLDWCHRACAKGYGLVYAADLSVAHPTRSDWAALRKKWRRITQESFGLLDGRAKTRGVWALRGLAMLVSVAPHGLRVLRHRDLSGPSERLAGLGALARLRLTRCIWMLRQALGQDI